MGNLINLQKRTGLPLLFNKKTGRLKFLNRLPAVQPTPRTLAAMRPYLQNPEAAFRKKDVYLMYRDVRFLKDKGVFRRNHLRYDLTVMSSGAIGKESVKTIGHYHPVKPGTKIKYPEIYEVVYGRALYLIQKMDNQYKKTLETYLIEAQSGQKVIIPPGFGHITINAGDDWLILADLSADNFKSIYEPYINYRGGAYYLLKNKKKGIVPNPHYRNLPRLKKLKPGLMENFGLNSKNPLYLSAEEKIAKFKFLTFPEKFYNQLMVKKLFVEK